MGGLATASLLAQVGGKRVLVLEQHFKLGGYMHSFRRKDFTWDPGVHYIGEMKEGCLARKCMDLVTGGQIDWHELGSPFETMIFPEGKFAFPSDPTEFREQLIARFPSERKGINQYIRDLRASQSWLKRWFISKQFGWPLSSLLSMGRKLQHRNTRDYFESRFDDPFLQGILTGQWPDFGSPPDDSAFGVHAAVAADYLDGGWYPIGGSETIVSGAVAQIEDAGGACLVSTPVREVLVRNNKAYGVEVERKGKVEVYTAPKIISNAGAYTTFAKLVPDGVAVKEKSKLAQVENGTSAVALYLGLNDDPRKHGFTDTNYWIYRRSDHRYRPHDPENPYPIEGAYLSFCSLRNPGQKRHTAQIITLSEQDEWKPFVDTQWKKRGSEYEAQKEAKTEQLLQFVEERVPGVRALIEYKELSTPLSFRDLTGHRQGAIYGQRCDSSRLSEHTWSISTSVKNFYMTGTDVCVPGINSALMIGVMTAGKLLGITGMPRIMSAANRT